MFRAISSVGYFGARSTAYKIIYSIKDLAKLTATDEIHLLDVYVDAMANALTKAFSYKEYQTLDNNTKETIRNIIAQHLYSISKTSRGVCLDVVAGKIKCIDSTGLVYSKWEKKLGSGFEIDEIRFPFLFHNFDGDLVVEIKKALLDAVLPFMKQLSTENEQLEPSFYNEKFPNDILLLIQQYFASSEIEESDSTNLNTLGKKY